MAFFNQAYPFDSSFWVRLFKGLLISFVIFSLIFWIPSPERYSYDRPSWQVALWMAGVFLFLWSVGSLLMPVLFKSYFQRQRWTLGRQVLWMIGFLLIVWAVSIPFYAIFLSQTIETVLNDRTFLLLFIGSFLISILTIFLRFFIGKRIGQKSANELNQILESYKDQKPPLRPPVHVHEKGKSVLNVASEKLLYFQADGKFAYGYCVIEGEVKRYFIRRNLRSIREDLDSLPQVVQCHTDVLVNIDNIRNFSGNAQGVHIHLISGLSLLPLAKNRIKQIEQKLQG